MSAHYPVQLFKGNTLVHAFKLSLSNWSSEPSDEVVIEEAIEQTKQDAEFLRTHPSFGKTYPEWDSMKVTTRPGMVVTVRPK